MSDFGQSLAITASGMRAQAMRLRLQSENIANADTPGFHRKTIAFQAEVAAGRVTGAVAPGKVALDQSELARIHDPAHPLADAEGYYRGSNVDLVVELADAREAQRSYEANLRLFDQVRQMSRNLLDLLRR